MWSDWFVVRGSWVLARPSECGEDYDLRFTNYDLRTRALANHAIYTNGCGKFADGQRRKDKAQISGRESKGEGHKAWSKQQGAGGKAEG